MIMTFAKQIIYTYRELCWLVVVQYIVLLEFSSGYFREHSLFLLVQVSSVRSSDTYIGHLVLYWYPVIFSADTL